MSTPNPPRHVHEAQANRIEALLAVHKAPGRVVSITVCPRFVQYRLVTGVTVKVNKYTTLSEELALALGSPKVRVYRDGSFLNVEVSREESSAIRLLDLNDSLRKPPPADTAILGIDERGDPLLLRIAASTVVHVLCVGTTGSGKSALARTMLASLALHNDPDKLQFSLIDPKGRGFGTLADLPHVVEPMVSDSQEAVARLNATVAEMEERDRSGRTVPRLIVAVDELADLIQTGGKPVEAALTRLAQRGRESGIHLLACTQKPSAALIGSAMKANFPVRLVGKVASRDEARHASGISDSGAEALGGRGDFLLVTDAKATRFQAAWLSKQDFGEIAGRIAAPPAVTLAVAGQSSTQALREADDESVSMEVHLGGRR